MEEKILEILQSEDIYDSFSYGSINEYEASNRITTYIRQLLNDFAYQNGEYSYDKDRIERMVDRFIKRQGNVTK